MKINLKCPKIDQHRTLLFASPRLLVYSCISFISYKNERILYIFPTSCSTLHVSPGEKGKRQRSGQIVDNDFSGFLAFPDHYLLAYPEYCLNGTRLMIKVSLFSHFAHLNELYTKNQALLVLGIFTVKPLEKPENLNNIAVFRRTKIVCCDGLLTIVEENKNKIREREGESCYYVQ